MGTESTCSLLLLCAVTLDVVVLRQVTPTGDLLLIITSFTVKISQILRFITSA